jgi:hypothetical protein
MRDQQKITLQWNVFSCTYSNAKMGRPQKYKSSPLFKLRRILGERSPMPQNEFAAKIDVSLDTIQAIETGRRGLTQGVLKKIVTALWAVWDPKGSRWMLQYASPPQEFTRELFGQYQSFIVKKAPIRESDPEVIKMRIDALFETVAADSWMKLYWRIQEALEQCLADLDFRDRGKLKALFGITEDQIHFSGMVGKPLWLQRTYRWPTPQYELKKYFNQEAKHYSALARSKSDPVTRSGQMEMTALTPRARLSRVRTPTTRGQCEIRGLR